MSSVVRTGLFLVLTWLVSVGAIADTIEPFIGNNSSKESREQTMALLKPMIHKFILTISNNRHIDYHTTDNYLNNGILLSDFLIENKLIDVVNDHITNSIKETNYYD